jgi:hypothetical protein
MSIPRPDLGAEHPQNIPLSSWTDGWLSLSVCQHTDTLYMISTDAERLAKGWPVTREEKIALLVANGDIPAAGIGEAV